MENVEQSFVEFAIGFQFWEIVLKEREHFNIHGNSTYYNVCFSFFSWFIYFKLNSNASNFFVNWEAETMKKEKRKN